MTGSDQAAARVEAAEARYKSLESHMAVALSGLMPHESLRPAIDAAIGLVRPELESVYVGYLAAKEEHDPLAQRVRELEYERERLLDCVRILRDDYPKRSKTWHALDDVLALDRALQAEDAAAQTPDLHYTITGHAVCGYGEGLAEDERRAALRGTADENDDITCAACRAYIAGRRAAEHKPRCGRTDEGPLGSDVGPCVMDHGHEGMHEEERRPGCAVTRWGVVDADDVQDTIRRLTQERDEARRALQDPETFERLVRISRARNGLPNLRGAL